MSDVTDLLDRLASGSTTLDDVVRDFETRTWPAPRDDQARIADALANADPEPEDPGSFAEVEQAYVDGQIDDQQYAALAQAAARGMGVAADATPNDQQVPADAAPPADTAAGDQPADVPAGQVAPLR